jgi:hypothetical protein
MTAEEVLSSFGLSQDRRIAGLTLISTSAICDGCGVTNGNLNSSVASLTFLAGFCRQETFNIQEVESCVDQIIKATGLTFPPLRHALLDRRGRRTF